MSDKFPTDKMLDDDQLDGISGGAAASLNLEADAILPSSGMGGSASPLDSLPAAAAPGNPTIKRVDIKKAADLTADVRKSDVMMSGRMSDLKVV